MNPRREQSRASMAAYTSPHACECADDAARAWTGVGLAAAAPLPL
jgi:hypothetical protein